jgi:type IV secretory pathway protease TraF
MSRILKRIAAGFAIAGVATLLLAAGGYAAGARVNTTKSIPVGLYWTSSAPVEKGAYVHPFQGVVPLALRSTRAVETCLRTAAAST